jgi:hypothetical protein
VSPLVEASIHLHETYRALMAGGFTKDEALTIVARAVAAAQAEG